MKKLLCALGVLLVTASAFGQGKPMDKKDIALTGDPSSPTLENNTDRHIIAYSIYWYGTTTGYGELVESFLDMRHGRPYGLAAHSKQRLQRDEGMQVAGRDGGGANRITRGKLEAVVFDDGEIVGLDTGEAELQYLFEVLDARVSSEKDLHGKLLKAVEQADKLADKTAAKREKDAAWADVAKATQRTGGRYADDQMRWAEELLRVRRLQGDDAAIALAKGSQRYPKIWRKK